MRTWITLLALTLCACTGTPGPPALDPVRQARLTTDGFREASAHVAARLDSAIAWAVFPDVEDTQRACAHEGRLFQPGAAPRGAVLRCSVRPSAPAGAAYHLLVILHDPADLERLRGGVLDLSGAAHLSPHDGRDGLPESTSLWVVTSERGGLFFDTWSSRQELELTAGE